jgi:hypothetical protein
MRKKELEKVLGDLKTTQEVVEKTVTKLTENIKETLPIDSRITWNHTWQEFHGYRQVFKGRIVEHRIHMGPNYHYYFEVIDTQGYQHVVSLKDIISIESM